MYINNTKREGGGTAQEDKVYPHEEETGGRDDSSTAGRGQDQRRAPHTRECLKLEQNRTTLS